MKLSFSWKLGIIITLFSVGLTSGCVFVFYRISYNALMTQIGKNMLHVGRLGVLMFDDEARQAIKRLKQATEENSIVTADDIATMEPRTTLKSLSMEVVERYHASNDYKLLLDVLSMVSLATYQDMEPRKSVYRLEEPKRFMNDGAFGLYLFVPIKESPHMEVVKYLASCAPVPTRDGWPGNPIGNLERSWEPLEYLLNGKSYVDDRLYTDEFYTSLTASVPILDKDGSTIALLGIDYAAHEERNKLIMLRLFCFALVLGSLLLSIVSSYFMARKLGSSLRMLSDAARKVANNDFSVSLEVKSNDEFATVGKVFNQMIISIREYMQALEEKHHQLATVVLDMHDGVGAILTGIGMNSEKKIVHEQQQHETNDNLEAINRLAREGLTEVRFLMNALDYDQCGFSSILEEIRMQGADILAPSNIKLDVQVLGDIPGSPINFSDFLQLQRIFREAFVNIVKHSSATVCTVTIDFSEVEIAVKVSDNGTRMKEKTANGGRGLKSLAGRAKQLGGKLEYCHENGFHLQFTIPHPPCFN